MFKLRHRLFAMLLCVAMLFTTAGFAFADDGHDGHDHGAVAVKTVGPVVRLDAESTGGIDGSCANSPTGGHEWIARDIEGYSDCPAVKGKQLYCQYCQQTRGDIVRGVHNWGEWTGAPNGCEGSYTQTRRCSQCGNTESRQLSGAGHSWVEKTVPATCTVPGKTYQQCSVCGATQNESPIPALGHKAAADDGDCTTEVKCARCGVVVTPAQSHNWSSSWSYDNVSHWHACTNPGCTAKTGVEKHNGTLSADCTRLSSCSTCGIKSASSGMKHNFDGTVYTMVSSSGHSVRCSNPGCMIAQDTVPHVADPTTGQSCTQSVKCVCGYTMTPAQKNHSYGAWVSTAAGHSHSCTRCGATESATHTGGSSNSCTTAITCTTCGYVLSPGYSDHSYGVWYAAPTGHARVCIHPGCSTIQNAAHTGGSATCVSGAVCSVCGASYGSKAANNHTGGTELRNAKPASVGAAGYTGDIYCLGCGKVITKGSTIKALEEDHTHSFSGAWKSDSASHWHECACGEHKDEAAHKFSGGKCSVCGAADPNYKVCSGNSHVGGTELRDAKSAGVGKEGYTGDTYCLGCGKLLTKGSTINALEESHSHSFSSGWRSDSVNHWRECACGERGSAARHSFSNSRCTVCGAIDPNGKYGGHTHSYGTWVSNGQEHWRECTVCGDQADRSAHVMLNDKCIECRMAKADVSVYKDVKEKDVHYEAIKQVVEAGLMSGVSDKEFKPAEQLDRVTLADVLYRLAGSPAASADNDFEDMEEVTACAQAVSWVTASDIMDAEGTAFEPERSITLQELVTVLWRLAQQAELDVKVSKNALSDYVNKDELEPWAEDAMAWALEAGLLEGLEDGESLPTGLVTRAEAAVIAAHFMDLVEASFAG